MKKDHIKKKGGNVFGFIFLILFLATLIIFVLGFTGLWDPFNLQNLFSTKKPGNNSSQTPTNNVNTCPAPLYYLLQDRENPWSECKNGKITSNFACYEHDSGAPKSPMECCGMEKSKPKSVIENCYDWVSLGYEECHYSGDLYPNAKGSLEKGDNTQNFKYGCRDNRTTDIVSDSKCTNVKPFIPAKSCGETIYDEAGCCETKNNNTIISRTSYVDSKDPNYSQSISRKVRKGTCVHEWVPNRSWAPCAGSPSTKTTCRFVKTDYDPLSSKNYDGCECLGGQCGTPAKSCHPDKSLSNCSLLAQPSQQIPNKSHFKSGTFTNRDKYHATIPYCWEGSLFQDCTYFKGRTQDPNDYNSECKNQSCSDLGYNIPVPPVGQYTKNCPESTSNTIGCGCCNGIDTYHGCHGLNNNKQYCDLSYWNRNKNEYTCSPGCSKMSTNNDDWKDKALPNTFNKEICVCSNL